MLASGDTFHARFGVGLSVVRSMLTTLSSKHLVRVRSRAEVHGATHVRPGRSGYNAPAGGKIYNVIYPDNECLAPGSMEKGVGTGQQGHTCEHRPRPADPPGRLRTGVG